MSDKQISEKSPNNGRNTIYLNNLQNKKSKVKLEIIFKWMNIKETERKEFLSFWGTT